MSIFFEINKRLKINEITKKNCRIIKSALGNIIKKKIDIKPPNDLLIDKKKSLWHFTRDHYKGGKKIFNC